MTTIEGRDDRHRNRQPVRVGLHAGQPLVAEITKESSGRLRLVLGDAVTTVVKVAAISVVAR